VINFSLNDSGGDEDDDDEAAQGRVWEEKS